MDTVTGNDENHLTNGVDGYFGLCPHCHKHDGYVNIGKGHWFVCHEHKVMWFVGSNLFSSWKDQTEEGQRRYYDERGLDSYKHLELEQVYTPPEVYERGEDLYPGTGIILNKGN